MVKTEKTQSTWQGGMRVDNQVGHHTLVIDQPVQMGGKDAGPNPGAYLLVALGGCLSTMAAIVPCKNVLSCVVSRLRSKVIMIRTFYWEKPRKDAQDLSKFGKK